MWAAAGRCRVQMGKMGEMGEMTTHLSRSAGDTSMGVSLGLGAYFLCISAAAWNALDAALPAMRSMFWVSSAPLRSTSFTCAPAGGAGEGALERQRQGSSLPHGGPLPRPLQRAHAP